MSQNPGGSLWDLRQGPSPNTSLVSGPSWTVGSSETSKRHASLPAIRANPNSYPSFKTCLKCYLPQDTFLVTINALPPWSTSLVALSWQTAHSVSCIRAKTHF